MDYNYRMVSLISKQWKCIGVLCVLFVSILFVLFLTAGFKFGCNLTILNGRKSNRSVHFSYSNQLVFETIETIRRQNCQEYLLADHNLRSCDSGSNQSDAGYMKRLPGCIIIGTYKSGTRELIDFLSMHPQINIRRDPWYEISYFDTNADKGIEWYRNQMPRSHPGQITIEKSPGYFYSEQTPRRIHKMNSSIKLVLLVRDPLRRTLSEFSFETSIARRQYGGSFYNCAINLWSKEINKHCFAIRHSLYDIPMERYLEFFNRSQILIIEADDFRQNPLRIMRKVEDHIGVSHVIKKENFVYNEDKKFYCVTKGPRDQFAECYDGSRGRIQHSMIDDALAEKLKSMFEEHNERFFELIGERFSWS